MRCLFRTLTACVVAAPPGEGGVRRAVAFCAFPRGAWNEFHSNPHPPISACVRQTTLPDDTSQIVMFHDIVPHSRTRHYVGVERNPKPSNLTKTLKSTESGAIPTPDGKNRIGYQNSVKKLFLGVKALDKIFFSKVSKIFFATYQVFIAHTRGPFGPARMCVAAPPPSSFGSGWQSGPSPGSRQRPAPRSLGRRMGC